MLGSSEHSMPPLKREKGRGQETPTPPRRRQRSTMKRGMFRSRSSEPNFMIVVMILYSLQNTTHRAVVENEVVSWRRRWIILFLNLESKTPVGMKRREAPANEKASGRAPGAYGHRCALRGANSRHPRARIRKDALLRSRQGSGRLGTASLGMRAPRGSNGTSRCLAKQASRGM